MTITSFRLSASLPATPTASERSLITRFFDALMEARMRAALREIASTGASCLRTSSRPPAVGGRSETTQRFHSPVELQHQRHPLAEGDAPPQHEIVRLVGGERGAFLRRQQPG